MSEHWIFFPCRLGDHSAWIFFDNGIRDVIDQEAPSMLLRVSVAFKQPGPDGMPTRNEFQQLTAYEDGLQALTRENNSLYVGRITSDSHRHFYIYTSDGNKYWSSRIDELSQRFGYESEFLIKPDEDHHGYWKELFPSQDDWRVINDMGVLEALRKHGDDGLVPRRVDHWGCFPTRETAVQLEEGSFFQIPPLG